MKVPYVKSFDVIGYVYKADTWCPGCTVFEVCEDNSFGRPTGFRDPDDVLKNIGQTVGIDVENEHTYDSDEFPKVIFADQYDEDVCAGCHANLL